MNIYIGIVGHFWTIQSILCMSKNLTISINQRSNTKKQSPITQSPVQKMNKSMKFKKFQNKILVQIKTFHVTINHIFVHFIGSKVGLYVSFRILLYVCKYDGTKISIEGPLYRVSHSEDCKVNQL